MVEYSTCALFGVQGWSYTHVQGMVHLVRLRELFGKSAGEFSLVFFLKWKWKEVKMADDEQQKEQGTPPLTRKDIPEIVKAVVSALTPGPVDQGKP